MNRDKLEEYAPVEMPGPCAERIKPHGCEECQRLAQEMEALARRALDAEAEAWGRGVGLEKAAGELAEFKARAESAEALLEEAREVLSLVQNRPPEESCGWCFSRSGCDPECIVAALLSKLAALEGTK